MMPLAGLALVTVASHGTPDIPKLPIEPFPAQHAAVKLLPDDSACDSAYKVVADASGSLVIQFEDLLSDSAGGKYHASCRLAGELVIPKGYQLDTSGQLTAVIKGKLTGGIDNVTGRLKFTLGRVVTRDFKLAEYDAQKKGDEQLIQLDLKAAVPTIETNCKEDTTWIASLFVESTINGVASAQIESMHLDSLHLLPVPCPIEPPKGNLP